MTLREAAQRTSRSVTTLRRYIRQGRLQASKRHGRFGPEYFVGADQLRAAGFHVHAEGNAAEPAAALAPRPGPGSAVDVRPGDVVPLSLYQELQMKHEQLLVQYGMVRAGGLRQMELRAELEEGARKLEDSRARLKQVSRHSDEEIARLRRGLRQAELDREGRELEIAALREKVRSLEMLTRNAVTNEDVERRFREVVDQSRKVERLMGGILDDRGPDGGKPEREH